MWELPDTGYRCHSARIGCLSCGALKNRDASSSYPTNASRSHQAAMRTRITCAARIHRERPRKVNAKTAALCGDRPTVRIHTPRKARSRPAGNGRYKQGGGRMERRDGARGQRGREGCGDTLGFGQSRLVSRCRVGVPVPSAHFDTPTLTPAPVPAPAPEPAPVHLCLYLLLHLFLHLVQHLMPACSLRRRGFRLTEANGATSRRRAYLQRRPLY